MSKKFLLVALAFAVIGLVPVAAQETDPGDDSFVPRYITNQRALGEQSFAISAGTSIPLFTLLLNNNATAGKAAGVHPTNLSVGGMGSLAYNFYVSSAIKLGLQVGGTFQWDINKNLLYMVPIFAKATYEFQVWDRFTIPVHLGLGINMTSWKSNFMVDPIIKPGVGFYFDWSSEWSFGLDTSYWFVPQLVVNDAQDKAIGNFMDVTISAEYHF